MNAARQQLRAVGDSAEAEGRQSAFGLWLPARTRAVLCVAFGPSLLPLALARRAERVIASSADPQYIAFLAGAARERGFAGLTAHLMQPGDPFPPEEHPDAAVVLGSPLVQFPEMSVAEAIQRFADVARQAFFFLTPGARLLVGWQTALGAFLDRTHVPLLRVARWHRLIYHQFLHGLLGPGTTPRDIILAFPSLWRPALLATKAAPAGLKRLALTHAGHLRGQWLVRVAAPGGVLFIPDALPPAVVLTFEKG